MIKGIKLSLLLFCNVVRNLKPRSLCRYHIYVKILDYFGVTVKVQNQTKLE